MFAVLVQSGAEGGTESHLKPMFQVISNYTRDGPSSAGPDPEVRPGCRRQGSCPHHPPIGTQDSQTKLDQDNFVVPEILTETRNGSRISFFCFGLHRELAQSPQLGSGGFSVCFASALYMLFYFPTHFRRHLPLDGASAGFKAV